MIISELLPSPTTPLRVWKSVAPFRAKTLWLAQSYQNDKRDYKIRYGEVLLRLRKGKFTSGDVSTCVAVWLSSRTMLFYYGKVLRLA